MTTDTQRAGHQIEAGLYLRAQKQIRSWSWGWDRKKSTSIAEAETERPWANLAEWLRAAHSLLDEQTGELNRNGDRSSQVPAIE